MRKVFELARVLTDEVNCKVTVRRFSSASMLLAITSLVAACGGGGGADGVVVTCATGGATNSAHLTWDAVSDPDLAGYKLYYGTSSETYLQSVDVNNVTAHTVTGLSSGVTYYFVATAYDSSSPPNESEFSNVVCKTIS